MLDIVQWWIETDKLTPYATRPPSRDAPLQALEDHPSWTWKDQTSILNGQFWRSVIWRS